MSLSVGIVGLPNVGKSTLFNALLKRQQAYVANFPFATIEPNVGIVPVPDNRLQKLSEVVKNEEKMNSLPPIVPATVEFVDIAGLIAGASKGEGLGNKFLSHIRETSAICHVLRVFSDPTVIKEGSSNPESDFEVVETELKLADLQTLEKQPTFADVSRSKKDPSDPELARAKVTDKLREALEKGVPAREVNLNEEEEKIAKTLNLLTSKPILVVLNVDEDDLRRSDEVASYFAERLKVNPDCVVAICAKTESELSSLDENDQKAYLADLDISESGLERLIRKAFSTLWGARTTLSKPAAKKSLPKRSKRCSIGWKVSSRRRSSAGAGRCICASPAMRPWWWRDPAWRWSNSTRSRASNPSSPPSTRWSSAMGATAPSSSTCCQTSPPTGSATPCWPTGSSSPVRTSMTLAAWRPSHCSRTAMRLRRWPPSPRPPRW